MIVSWPAGIKARGELRHNPGHITDLAPTILELAGGKWPQTLDGRPVPPPHGKNLVPALAVDGAVKRECIWWLHEDNRAIRVGDWKLVSAAKQGGQWELYDLGKDRCESHDLAAAMPDKVRQLGQLWAKKADEIRALRFPMEKARPRQELARR